MSSIPPSLFNIWIQNGRHFANDIFKLDPNFTENCSQGISYQFSSIGLENGVLPNGWQAIFWTSDGPVYWHVYVSFGFDKLIVTWLLDTRTKHFRPSVCFPTCYVHWLCCYNEVEFNNYSVRLNITTLDSTAYLLQKGHFRIYIIDERKV